MLILSCKAGDFGDALENWIIDNKCNPATPEEWERCLKDLIAAGVVEVLDKTDSEDVATVKKALEKKFNVEEI